MIFLLETSPATIAQGPKPSNTKEKIPGSKPAVYIIYLPIYLPMTHSLIHEHMHKNFRLTNKNISF